MAEIHKKILDTTFDSQDFGEITLRTYLARLLYTLWWEGQNFNPKYPFENGLWDWDIYKGLITNGFVSGKLDECEDIVTFDQDTANSLMRGCIEELCGVEIPVDEQ